MLLVTPASIEGWLGVTVLPASQGCFRMVWSIVSLAGLRNVLSRFLLQALAGSLILFRRTDLLYFQGCAHQKSHTYVYWLAASGVCMQPLNNIPRGRVGFWWFIPKTYSWIQTSCLLHSLFLLTHCTFKPKAYHCWIKAGKKKKRVEFKIYSGKKKIGKLGKKDIFWTSERLYCSRNILCHLLIWRCWQVPDTVRKKMRMSTSTIMIEYGSGSFEAINKSYTYWKGGGNKFLWVICY